MSVHHLWQRLVMNDPLRSVLYEKIIFFRRIFALE